MTLVGLMVGTTISMIVILGLMALYRNVLHVSVEAGQDARHEGQVSTGLMGAQMLLQAAGFRLDNSAYGSHLVVLSGSALTAGALSATAQAMVNDASLSPAADSASGDAIVWVANSPGGDLSLATCGLLRPAGAAGGLSHSTAPCPSGRADGWSTLSWSTPRTLVETQAVRFRLVRRACRPFGVEEGAGGLQVEVSTASVQGEIVNSVCLANFSETAAASPSTGS